MDKKPNINDELLTEGEAISLAWNIVEGWKKKSETWALRYSCGCLAGLSSICGLLINNYYRKKLQLRRYGYLSSALPLVVLPGTLTLLYHKHMVSTKLIMNSHICPICYEIKSAVIQIGFGAIYPMILAPISAFMLATRYSTYRLPSIAENPKASLQVFIKISKPLKNTLLSIIIGQLVASSLLTYFQLQNTVSIRHTIDTMEEDGSEYLN